LGATLRTIYRGRFDTMDRGEERKAAEVVKAPPDRKLTHHRLPVSIDSVEKHA
jgi:hypothetical protein